MKCLRIQEKYYFQKDELRQSKDAYDKDLETIYRDDHDTNAQRVRYILIHLF